ncbi:exported hypothetical protein [Gammaproteobacteria bacterium]
MHQSTALVAFITATSLLASLSAEAGNGRHNAFAMGAVAGAIIAPLLAAPRVVYSEPAVVYREPVVVHREPRVVYEEVYYEEAPLPRGQSYSRHSHHKDYFDD